MVLAQAIAVAKHSALTIVSEVNACLCSTTRTLLIVTLMISLDIVKTALLTLLCISSNAFLTAHSIQHVLLTVTYPDVTLLGYTVCNASQIVIAL